VQLSWADYLVIGGYLAAITAFGSWFARFQKTTRDYFLTDRSVPWWAVCFTIVATETSTLTFIGIPAAAYAGNMTFLQLALGYVIGRILVSILFIPAYFRGDLFTSYELLQRRLGSRVKTLSAVIFLITRSLADGIRLFATALVIAVVTQVPVTVVVLVLGVAMIVYTVRGGVSAVIWTDVVQMFVYIAGAGAVAYALLARIPGGWSAVVAAGAAAGKFQMLDTSLDWSRAYTLWAGLLGGVCW
jgi:solute:Na+ symporter, SSS family